MIRSPIFLRPDTIILKNKCDEVDFKMQYLETTINHVRVDESFGIKQSKRGIDSDNTAVIVVDLNDLDAIQDDKPAKYVDKAIKIDGFYYFIDELGRYLLDESGNKIVSETYSLKGFFTIQCDDIIIYNDKKYTVTKVNNAKRGVGAVPVFLEVFVK